MLFTEIVYFRLVARVGGHFARVGIDALLIVVGGYAKTAFSIF
jgi:hypothetical protein